MKVLQRRIYELLIAAVFVAIVYPDRPLENVRRFLRESEQQEPVKKYSQDQIEATAPHLETFHPRLFVWSEGDGFRVYNLDHKDSHYQAEISCGRCPKTIALIVNILMENYSYRFQAGQPVFQMLWSDADSFQSHCVNKRANCRTDEFSPVPLFGSVPKDPEVLPTVKAMPNWFYVNCLYNWKFGVASPDGECWNEKVNASVDWNDLEPTIIWRGSDFTFLPTYDESQAFITTKNMVNFIENFANEDRSPESLVMELFDHWNELNPRWKAIALSAHAHLSNETWIDAKFVGHTRESTHQKFHQRGVEVATDKKMDTITMSHYKYQLDLGGGGGTSWRGTLSKLLMPGVLLHHETQTKDWWYGEMKEYKHYFPINLDLTDLEAKWRWAEKQDKVAKKVAAEGTKLAQYLFSEEYMKKVHDELFVDYLGKLVDNYVHHDASWHESNARYKANGFVLTEVAYCRSSRCYTNVRDDVFRTFPHVVVPGALVPNLGVLTENEQSQAVFAVTQENDKLHPPSSVQELQNNETSSILAPLMNDNTTEEIQVDKPADSVDVTDSTDIMIDVSKPQDGGVNAFTQQQAADELAPPGSINASISLTVQSNADGGSVLVDDKGVSAINFQPEEKASKSEGMTVSSESRPLTENAEKQELKADEQTDSGYATESIDISVDQTRQTSSEHQQDTAELALPEERQNYHASSSLAVESNENLVSVAIGAEGKANLDQDIIEPMEEMKPEDTLLAVEPGSTPVSSESSLSSGIVLEIAKQMPHALSAHISPMNSEELEKSQIMAEEVISEERTLSIGEPDWKTVSSEVRPSSVIAREEGQSSRGAMAGIATQMINSVSDPSSQMNSPAFDTSQKVSENVDSEEKTTVLSESRPSSRVAKEEGESMTDTTTGRATQMLHAFSDPSSQMNSQAVETLQIMPDEGDSSSHYDVIKDEVSHVYIKHPQLTSDESDNKLSRGGDQPQSHSAHDRNLEESNQGSSEETPGNVIPDRPFIERPQQVIASLQTTKEQVEEMIQQPRQYPLGVPSRERKSQQDVAAAIDENSEGSLISITTKRLTGSKDAPFSKNDSDITKMSLVGNGGNQARPLQSQQTGQNRRVPMQEERPSEKFEQGLSENKLSENGHLSGRVVSLGKTASKSNAGLQGSPQGILKGNNLIQTRMSPGQTIANTSISTITSSNQEEEPVHSGDMRSKKTNTATITKPNQPKLHSNGVEHNDRQATSQRTVTNTNQPKQSTSSRNQKAVTNDEPEELTKRVLLEEEVM